MANYIDKSALVAKIESKRKYAQTLGDNAINSSMQQFYDGMKQGCVDILSFINNLEVKEVDLEKEINGYFKGWGDNEVGCFAMMQDGTSVGVDDCIDIAQHFFELGIKAQKGK